MIDAADGVCVHGWVVSTSVGYAKLTLLLALWWAGKGVPEASPCENAWACSRQHVPFALTDARLPLATCRLLL